MPTRPRARRGPPADAWRRLLALLALAALLAAALAQPDLRPRALEPEELDAATVARAAARFELDTIVYDVLSATGVPGVVVAIAHGGTLLTAEAYGTADVERGRALTLDDPLWLASLSKTLTSIAVLDLAARGEVDLHAPLETLLGPGMVPPPPEGDTTALTAWHLLTHTSGFDERILGSADMAGGPNPPIATLALPPRVEPAGSGPRYGNAGHHALGLLLEAVTGEDLEGVLQTLVFEPLGLDSGRVLRPAEEAYEAASVRAHTRDARGALVPLITPTPLDAAAGGLRLSGHDVGRLLAALTAPTPAGPLANEVRTALIAPAARAHPLAAGTTAGMLEGWLLGHDVVLQPGDLPGLHSLLVIVPSVGLGVFVHVNGPARDDGTWATVDGLRDPRWWLAERIVERFVGDGRTPAVAVDVASLDPATLALPGAYRPDRVPRSGPAAFVGLTGLSQFPVQVEADGSLSIVLPAEVSTPRRYLPSADGVYVRDEGGDMVAVTRRDDGSLRLHGALSMPITLEPVPTLERLELVLASLGAAALAALLALTSWPIGALHRWRSRAPRSSAPGANLLLLRWSARLQGLATLAWFAVTLRAIDDAQVRLALDLERYWPWGSATLALIVISALVLVLVGTLFAITGGSDRRGPRLRPRAAFHVLLGLAGLALALQAWVWQLPPWGRP